MTVKPRQPAPPLEVKLLDGSTWRLGDAKPATFEMIVVYRGLHCPVCKTYLGELESKLPEFAKRGVDVIAVSTDDRDRAQRAKREWGLNNLRVGCEHVDRDRARSGSCSSRARSARESRRNSASPACSWSSRMARCSTRRATAPPGVARRSTRFSVPSTW